MTAEEKATFREVQKMFTELQDKYLIPQIESQARIETTLANSIITQKEGFEYNRDMHIDCYGENVKEHKALWKRIDEKISIKAFTSWLSAALALIGLGLFLLKFFGILI
ncbi:MAG: hypothetical protein ACYCXQ_01040 [Candidatus Humimicrobiaceae bacterium]